MICPPRIKSELGSLNGWVYVDISTDDVGGYVAAAKGMVDDEVKLPPGYASPCRCGVVLSL